MFVSWLTINSIMTFVFLNGMAIGYVSKSFPSSVCIFFSTSFNATKYPPFTFTTSSSLPINSISPFVDNLTMSPVLYAFTFSCVIGL